MRNESNEIADHWRSVYDVLEKRCLAYEKALRDIQNAYGDPHAEDFVTTTARETLEQFQTLASDGSTTSTRMPSTTNDGTPVHGATSTTPVTEASEA